MLGAAGALVVWLVSGPLAFLLLTAFRETEDALPFEPGVAWTLQNFVRVYDNPVLYRQVLPDTLLYTAGAVALTMALGIFFAWLVERTNVPLRNLLFIALLSPVIVPSVVVAIAWIFLVGPRTGWVNLVLRWGLGLPEPGPLDIFSLGGVIVAQGLALVPLSFLFMTAAFRSMDPALEDASALCRARPFTTFRRVTLPVLLPATLALLIVVTTLTLEGFEIPMVIGVPARLQILSTWIFFAINPPAGLPNYGQVAAIAVPFVVLGAALLAAYNRATRVAERYAVVTGRGYRPRRVDLGRWRYPALVVVMGYLLLVLVLPATVMLASALIPAAGRAAASGTAVSFEPFVNVLGNPTTLLAFRNTVVAGALGATIVVFIACSVSWIVVSRTWPTRSRWGGPACRARRSRSGSWRRCASSRWTPWPGARRPSSPAGSSSASRSPRALVSRPRLLLLDEPLSNLDAKLREQMRQELAALVAALGMATLYVTHDQSEALAMSQRIAVMNRGRVAQEGTPEEIYASPAHPFVAEFVGTANFFEGAIASPPADGMAVVEARGGRLACRWPGDREGVRAGTRVTVVVRPEDIEISREAPVADANVSEATVEHVTYLGHALECRAATVWGRVCARTHPAPKFRPGERLFVRLPPEACRILLTSAAWHRTKGNDA